MSNTTVATDIPYRMVRKGVVMSPWPVRRTRSRAS